MKKVVWTCKNGHAIVQGESISLPLCEKCGEALRPMRWKLADYTLQEVSK